MYALRTPILILILLQSACMRCQRECCISDDAQVFESALLNLANDRTDSPVVNFADREHLYFEVKPFRAEHDVWSGQVGDPWKELTGAQVALANEARTNMLGRAQEPGTFDDLHPRDCRLRRQTIEEAKRESDAGRREIPYPVSAWLPGFTKDRSYAVIRMLVPWGMHSAGVMFLLAKERGEWRVVSRQYVVYP